MAEAEQVGGRAKRASWVERGRGVGGAVRLQKAASRAVGRNSRKLTQMLLDKALAGNVESTKLLVALAEPKKTEEKPKKKRRGLTEAQRLALEPAWDTLSPEEQKRILIRNGDWSHEHNCPTAEVHFRRDRSLI
jgi:hypothetical protein